jgi:hypothetical protein
VIAHVIEDAGEAHAVAAQFEGRVLFQDGPVGKDAREKREGLCRDSEAF